MKFIHTSDWHIGASTKIPDYLKRQSDVIDHIFSLAETSGIKTVVVAGDLFETDTPSANERDILLSKLITYDAMGFEILMIPGNHDLSDMTGYTSIHYLCILNDLGVFRNSLVCENTRFHISSDTLFVLMVHLPGQFNNEIARVLSLLSHNSLGLPYNKVVLVAHETIRGSVSDTRFRIQQESAPKIEFGEEIKFTDFTYMALGDIHIHQMVGPKSFYCGAPLQIKFGDQYPKGVLIVDTDKPETPEFVPIPSRQLVVIDASHANSIPEDAHVKLTTDKPVSQDDLPNNICVIAFSSPEMNSSGISGDDIDIRSVLTNDVITALPDEDEILIKREIDSLLSNLQ